MRATERHVEKLFLEQQTTASRSKHLSRQRLTVRHRCRGERSGSAHMLATGIQLQRAVLTSALWEVSLLINISLSAGRELNSHLCTRVREGALGIHLWAGSARPESEASKLCRKMEYE